MRSDPDLATATDTSRTVGRTAIPVADPARMAGPSVLVTDPVAPPRAAEQVVAALAVHLPGADVR